MVNLCFNVTGPYLAIWLNIVSGCVLRVFPEGISLWIDRLNKADGPS